MRRRGRLTVGLLFGFEFYGGNLIHFYETMLRGVRAAAQEHGCNLLLSYGVGDETHEGCAAWPDLFPCNHFTPVGPWNTDGLIVIGPIYSDEIARLARDLAAGGRPLVFVSAVQDRPVVMPDNKGGIRQAVAHLAAHGHHRIAFIAGRREDSGDSRERLEAFRSAVREFGLVCDDRLIAWGAFWRGRRCGRLWIRRCRSQRSWPATTIRLLAHGPSIVF